MATAFSGSLIFGSSSVFAYSASITTGSSVELDVSANGDGTSIVSKTIKEKSALDEKAIFSELKEVSSTDLFLNIVTYNIYALAFEYSKTQASKVFFCCFK